MAAAVTGTATGFFDFLQKLITYLTTEAQIGTGEAWALQTNTTSSYTADGYIVLSTVGTNGNTFVLGINTNRSIPDAKYNLQFDGGTGYLVGQDWQSQANSIKNMHPSTTQPQLCLQDTNFTYLFKGDKNHVVIRVQTGSVCQVAYFGFFNPFAPPSNYPNPIIIGASGGNTALRWDGVNSDGSTWFLQSYHASTASVSSNPPSCWFRGSDNAWYPVRYPNTFNTATKFGFFWPPQVQAGNMAGSKTTTNITRIDRTEGGKFALFDFLVIMHDTPYGGDIDGNKVPVGSLKTMKHIFGDGLVTTGDIIQWGGNDYEVVTNWNLTSGQNFAVIAKGP